MRSSVSEPMPTLRMIVMICSSVHAGRSILRCFLRCFMELGSSGGSGSLKYSSITSHAAVSCFVMSSLRCFVVSSTPGFLSGWFSLSMAWYLVFAVWYEGTDSSVAINPSSAKASFTSVQHAFRIVSEMAACGTFVSIVYEC